jgi:hypothetical protein
VVEAPAVTLRATALEDPAGIVTMELLRVAVIPVGTLGGESVTVPENPFRLEMVRVDVWNVPWFMVRLEGFEVMLKSGGGG